MMTLNAFAKCKAEALRVLNETANNIFDFLCDVAEDAITDWTDENGHIDGESVDIDIENQADLYISHWMKQQYTIDAPDFPNFNGRRCRIVEKAYDPTCNNYSLYNVRLDDGRMYCANACELIPL